MLQKPAHVEALADSLLAVVEALDARVSRLEGER